MIRFFTLGSIDFQAEDDGASGEDAAPRDLLGQDKPLALLSYLAVETPRGYHRRDTLLGLLWPELDESHARNALSQALYRLRSSLGREVIRNRGDEVAVDAGRLWCDAAALHDAAREGDPERVLELYRGEFLRGLHVSGSAAYGHWLDRARTRLQRRAVAAAETLRQEAAGDGRYETAVRWARRQVELIPLDEAAVRALMRLQAEAGDRTGALQAFETFRKRLRREMDAAPAQATLVLVDSLRGAPADAVSDAPEATPPGRPPAGDARAGDSAAGGAAPPPAGAPGWSPEPGPFSGEFRRRSSFRSWAAAVAGVAVFLVAVLALGRSLLGPDGESGGASPDRLAVLPFAVEGSQEFQYLREGMVDLLAARLDGVGRLRSVDPRAVLAMVDAGDGVTGPEDGRRAARELGAGLFVLGSVVEAGEGLQLSAFLYGPEADRVAAARARIPGERDLPAGVDRLAVRLAAEIGGSVGSSPAEAATATTGSVGALKAYLRGERLFREGRYMEAHDAFREALEGDADFALAALRAKMSAEYAVGWGLEPVRPQRLDAVSGPLPQRSRLLLAARAASQRGAAAEAERRYREVLGLYPEDTDALFGLAEVLFHYGPSRGVPRTAARPYFERLLQTMPGHVPALWHLGRIAAAEGRWEVADSLLRRTLDLNPANRRRLEIRALRAAVGPATDRADSVLADLASARYPILVSSAWRVAVDARQLPLARRIAALLTDRSRSRETRVLGRVLLAHLDLATADWRGALAELRRAGQLRPAFGLEYRSYFSALPWVEVPDGEVAALLDSLEAFRPARVPPVELEDPFLSIHDGAHAALRRYLQGLLLARSGKTEAALARADELATGAPRAPSGATSDSAAGSTERSLLGPRLARSLRGYALWRSDRPERALATLQALPEGASEERIRRLPLSFDALERYLRARLLAGAGDAEGALRWYDSFGGGSPLELVWLAPSHLARGELYEALGRADSASAHYGRVLDLWSRPDHRLAPAVQRVRERWTGTGRR